MPDFKAVFCCLNSKYIHSSLAPWCLYTSCRKHCENNIRPEVQEGTINEKDEDIISRILQNTPNLVSFSCYIWNITKVLAICKKIKELSPNTIIVLGGPEVSFNPGELLRGNGFVDYVVSGAGEVTVPRLLNSIYRGDETNIPCVSFKKDGVIYVDTSEAPTDESISPYCEEYFSSLKGRIAYIESSRGCPFSCAFCLSGRLGKVKYIDLERVKKEMLTLSSLGAKTVKFVDRTFNCNKKRAGEILGFIAEQYGKGIPEGTCFHFEIAADLLDKDLFEIIARLPSGAVQFEVGIQSFNKNTLKAINRKTDTKKVTESLKRLISLGNCHVHIDLIAGLPREDYKSFKAGFNRAYDIGANMLQLGFLKILKGSPMAQSTAEYPCEYSKNPPYEVISTPWITSEELQLLHVAENELEHLYNSGRFLRSLSYVLSATKITPFDLFMQLGKYLRQKGFDGSAPLDKYTNAVFDCFAELDGVDKMSLRNAMITDRIATNNSGVIPERLKINDPQLKKVKNFIRQTNPLKKGTNRTVAILYGESRAVFCDYDSKNPVTNEYSIRFVDITDTK